MRNDFLRFFVWFLERVLAHLLDDLIVDIKLFWWWMTSSSSLIRENYLAIFRFVWSGLFQNRLHSRSDRAFIARWLFKKLIDCVKLSQKSISLHVFHKEHLLLWRRHEIILSHAVLVPSWRPESCPFLLFCLKNSLTNKVRSLFFQMVDLVEIVSPNSFIQIRFGLLWYHYLLQS